MQLIVSEWGFIVVCLAIVLCLGIRFGHTVKVHGKPGQFNL
jgi:hypothetical protein